MSLKQQLQDDVKVAMREKSEMVLSVLRMVLAAVSNEEIRLGKQAEGLSDAETLGVLKKQVKQRNDAIELYQSGGDQARAAKEEEERKILEHYLPAQASLQDIEKGVEEVLASHPGVVAQDFGAIMKKVMAKFSGNADGKMVSEALKKRLASSV